MAQRRLSHVIGIDDAPFEREHRGDVLTVGVAFADTRPVGVLSTRVRRDGTNSTRAIADMVRGSQFHAHLHAVLFQGIALAGFNVVDIHALAEALDKAVLVVARKQPNFPSIRRALLEHVRGGAAKWRLIERAGPMEPAGNVFVQRAGLDLGEAEELIARLGLNGNIPEPLRLAHLIAGGVTTGRSRGRS